MRADQWAGLVTSASPYILPAGAAVEQVNLSLTVPGQLTTRAGMRAIACTVAADDILDCYPYESNGQTILIALTASGALVALPSPAYGVPSPLPSEPTLNLTEGQTGVTYTNRFSVGLTTESAPSPPAPDVYADVLDGGVATTTSWPYVLTPGGASTGTADLVIDSGTASTPAFPPVLLLSSLPTA
jgi:hypothetical protein